jgi:hypothetical protein
MRQRQPLLLFAFKTEKMPKKMPLLLTKGILQEKGEPGAVKKQLLA